MPEAVSGTFVVNDAAGNPIFKIDPTSTFVQITYMTPSGQLLAELNNAGHLGLFDPTTGASNIQLDPFNISGQPHVTVTANPGTTGVRVVGAATGAVGLLVAEDPVFHEHTGVYGESDKQGVTGVTSQNDLGAFSTGVFGFSKGGGGIGVRGETVTGVAVMGRSFGPGLAAQFEGGVDCNGQHTVNGPCTINGEHVVNGNCTTNGTHAMNGTITMGAAGDIVFADCAEEFETVEELMKAEPGSVMVMDDDGVLKPCDSAHDRRVVGVVSGAGNYRAGIVLDKSTHATRRAAIALVGKVYCSVDANYAPIRVGDLLTTSPTSGHAMRVSDPAAALGSVLGKAAQSLPSGRGQIRIVVLLT